MLSPAIRTAAYDYAASQGTPVVQAVAQGYLVGYCAGARAPRAKRFPLPGDVAFKRLLGAYLAERIDVYHPKTNRYGLLRGLPACYEHDGEPFADVEFYADAEAREEGGGDDLADANKILPVRYSFEDLATEMVLADGRRVVPAVEVAKLGGGHDNIDGAELSEDVFKNKIISLTAYGKHCWSLYPHDFFAADTGYGLPEINWLRQHHFAIGLIPHQYHRRVVGFDYASGERPEKCASCAVGCEKGKEVSRAL